MAAARVRIVRALRAAGDAGLGVRDVTLLRTGLPAHRVRGQLLRMRDDDGVVYQTGLTRASRWHARYRSVRVHLLAILEPGEWWYELDLIEAMLCEDPTEVPPAIASLVADGVVELDSRGQLRRVAAGG